MFNPPLAEKNPGKGCLCAAQDSCEKKCAYGVFDDALAAFSIGTWKVEKDEGKEPRMYADATMLKLIGIDDPTGMTPEEIHHAWADRVDPAHLDALEEGTRYMAEGLHAEIQYPWHHPDGRTIIVRCGGVRDMTYTKGLRITGIHQWVTTMKHVDRQLEAEHRQLEAALAEARTANADLTEAIRRRDEASELDRQYDRILHETLGATRWTYTISPSGEVTSARYGDRIVSFLGGDTGPMDWLKYVHSEDRERVEANFMAAARDPEGKRTYEESFRIGSEERGWHWAKSSGRIVLHEDGSRELVGLSLDITDTVEEQQKRLLGAVPISPDVLHKANIGLWAFELDEGEPPRMYHDQTMLGLVGLDRQLPPEEAYHAWYDHVDKDCYQLVNDAVAKMMAGEHAEVQYPWHHPDGHTMIVRCGGVRNFSYTKGIRVEGTHQNVSEVLHYDEAEEKRRHELAVAKASNEAKTQFLFSMSHDIRTPMNAIMGFTEIARKKLNTMVGRVRIDDAADHGGFIETALPELEGVSDCLEKIDSSGKLLLTLINSVLDMSRVEAGKAKLEENAGDVMLSFVNIEPTMQTLARSRDIALSFEFGQITDRYVYADFEKTNRVFVNLISNAIKYSKPNGYVKVRCEQVGALGDRPLPQTAGSDLRADRVAWFRYTFEDNGIGMGEAFQRHVFEEFAREYSTTKSGIQGTGLGLALCKTFVELMGGTIECRSKKGEGTTFAVEIPFRVQEGSKKYVDPSTGVAKERGADGEDGHAGRVAMPDFKGKRVLLVEDNELNREVAEYVLKEQGFVVESAEDGSIAVRLVKEKGHAYYDYILMDIQMPVMGGYEATKAIRAEGFKRPIIALSANAFAEDRAASIAAGMDDHVAKPIKVKELLTALAKFGEKAGHE